MTFSPITIKRELMKYFTPDKSFHHFEVRRAISEIFNVFSSVYSGAEKSCYVFDGYDFVLKVCFGHPEKSINSEPKLYQSAKRRGIDHLFAKSFNAFEINGILCYFQEKVTGNESNACFIMKFLGTPLRRVQANFFAFDYIPNKSNELKDCSQIFYSFEDRAHIIFTICGEKIFEQLIKFCHYYLINDLHDNNVICQKDGTIKIIDYSGIH